MSDGQLQQTHEEWVKTHDELQQLRDKLESIRKKGGWMEGVPEEEGEYWIRRKHLEPYIVRVIQRRMPGGLFVACPKRYECYTVARYISEGYEFARILTPEDLE